MHVMVLGAAALSDIVAGNRPEVDFSFAGL